MRADSTQMSPKKIRHVNSTTPKPNTIKFLIEIYLFIFFPVRPYLSVSSLRIKYMVYGASSALRASAFIRAAPAQVHSAHAAGLVNTGPPTQKYTNFGPNVAPEGVVQLPRREELRSFQEFSPPTLFRIGFAFEALQDDINRITTSLQLNHPNDNSENLALGVEYAWNEIMHLRCGYKLNVDEEGLTAGIGVLAPVGGVTAGVDYAFAEFGRLGGVHRLTIRLGM